MIIRHGQIQMAPRASEEEYNKAVSIMLYGEDRPNMTKIPKLTKRDREGEEAYKPNAPYNFTRNIKRKINNSPCGIILNSIEGLLVDDIPKSLYEKTHNRNVLYVFSYQEDENTYIKIGQTKNFTTRKNTHDQTHKKLNPTKIQNQKNNSHLIYTTIKKENEEHPMKSRKVYKIEQEYIKIPEVKKYTVARSTENFSIQPQMFLNKLLPIIKKYNRTRTMIL
jgi:hypothetical protein